MDTLAKAVLDRHSAHVRSRSEMDSVWQEVKDFVRPDTADFAGGQSRPGDARRRMYDSTASWSLDQLASGLHSHLSSPVDTWFMLGVTGVPYAELSFEEKFVLEQNAERIYAQFSSASSGFNSAIHETYLDIGAFGTGVLFEWMDMRTMTLKFRAYPLADCWVKESMDGTVNELQRVTKYTVGQVEEEFGPLPEKLGKMKKDDHVKVIHEVRPRKSPNGRGPKGKAFSSSYVCKDTSETLLESGFDYFPYHAPRWTKLAGESYGRGPGLSVLPDIRMVNTMSHTVIVAAQKMVDPPLMVEDDGYLLPLRTVPGGINYRRPGAEPILPIPTAQRIDIGVEMIEQRREMIRRGFYVDWLVRQQKRERQTAQEVMDERNQMLSMLGPVVGRLQSELLGPVIQLSYRLLGRHNMMVPLPESLRNEKLEINYVSPAAKAQSITRGQGMMSYLQQVTQLLPVLPNLIHSINEDALNSELQDLTDAPRRILNDPEETARRRQAAQEQEQAALTAQALPQVAKASKDFAQAQEAGAGIL